MKAAKRSRTEETGGSQFDAMDLQVDAEQYSDAEEEESESESEEFEDEEGIQDAEVDLQPVRSKANMLPTKDEQLALRETENLMRTGLLRLQTDEMLGEVRSKQRSKRLDQAFADLKRALSAADACSVNAAWLAASGLRAIQLHSSDSSLDFATPTDVFKVGSYDVDLVTSPYLNLDICVTMPDECFDKRDILNHVYFDKRKLYLAVLLTIVRDNNILPGSSLTVALLKGDARKPIVILEHLKYRCSVRIIPVISCSCFKLSQLRLGKNNSRPQWWVADLKDARMTATHLRLKAPQPQTLDESVLAPTPHYNQAILEDAAAFVAHDLIAKTVKSVPNASSVVLLFKVWLTQIQQRFSSDGLDSHGATLLVCYLLHVRLIPTQTHGLSGFQTLLKFIADSDFGALRMDFTATRHQPGTPATALTSMSLMMPLQDDCSLNVLWRVSNSSLQSLKRHARESLALLQEASDTAFEQTFMRKRDFFLQHNMYFHIPVPELARPLAKSDYSKRSIFSADYDMMLDLQDVTCAQYTASKSMEVLQRALGDRVVAMSAVCRSGSAMEDSAHSPSLPFDEDASTASWVVTVGLVLSPEHASRRVDRGPSADEEEALASFRAFWGPRSETRRFKDGAIVESLVWKSAGDRLVEEIVRYVSGQHLWGCGEEGELVRCVSAQLEDELPAQAEAESASRAADKALVELRRMLTSALQDYPVSIESLSASSPALRNTALLPPVASPLLAATKSEMRGQLVSKILTPLTVIASLSSGRWPAELVALKKTKSALILRLSELVRRQFNVRTVAHGASIDIVVAGFVFRVLFNVPQEVSLAKDSASLHRLLTSAPLHHSFIQGLHTRFRSYSTVVRLTVLWLDRHSFSGQVAQEAVELIVASVYIDSGDRPLSSSAGFLRTLMKIAEFDWQGSFLFVNLQQGEENSGRAIKSDELAALRLSFNELRARHGMHELPMFVVSNATRDVDGRLRPLYSARPEAVVLRLIMQAASSSAAELLQWVKSSDVGEGGDIPEGVMNSSSVRDSSNVRMAFSTSVFGEDNDDDVWTSHLRGPRFAQLKLFSNLSSKELAFENFMLVGEEGPHPIHANIVSKLRQHFGHLALFFWDRTNAAQLYIVWRPKALLPHSFGLLQSRYKVSLLPSSSSETKSGGDPFMVLNVAEVLSEMLVLSGHALEIESIL